MHLNCCVFWEQGRERGWWWIQMFTQPLLLDFWLALLTMCLATQNPEPSWLSFYREDAGRGNILVLTCIDFMWSSVPMVTCTSEAGDSLCFCGIHSLLFVSGTWSVFGLSHWHFISPIFLGLSWYFSSTFFSSPRLSIIVILGACQGEEKKNACVQSVMFNQKLLKPTFKSFL